MIDSNEYNSKRTTGDDQQHDGRRHRSMNKPDFRFLIPSRDAGGRSNEYLFKFECISSIYSSNYW